MKLFTVAGMMVALLLGGCGLGSGGDVGAGADEALMLGTVEGALTPEGEPADLTVEVNNDPADLELGSNLDFAVRHLPTGQVHVAVTLEGIRGTLDLDDVKPGEIVEVKIVAGDGSLTIGVVRRTPPEEQPPAEDAGPVHEGPLTIDGHHLVYRLAEGVYAGDVIITGHHITVVGAGNPGCEPGGGTVIKGDLVVRGHHIQVVGLDVQGRVSVEHRSHHVSVTEARCEAGGHHDRDRDEDDDHDRDEDDDHDRDEDDDRDDDDRDDD